MANVAQILCDVIPHRVYTKQTHAVLMFIVLRRCSTMQTDRRTDGPPDRYTEIPLNTHYASNVNNAVVCIFV